MSVINKMLRDLEARRVAPVAAPGAVQATAPQRKGGRLLGLMLLGGAATAAVAFGDWPSLLAAKASPAPTPQVVAQAEEPAAAPQSAAPKDSSASNTLPADPAPSPMASRLDTVAIAATPASPVIRATAAPRAAAPPPAPAHPAPSAAPAPAAGTRQAMVTPATAATPATAPLAAPPTAATAATVEKRMAALPPALRAQALFRQGLEQAGTGHGRQAVERLQEALKLDPALAAARIHAASLLLEQGRGAEAEALAREGLALTAHEPQLATLLARVLADRGDAAGALALLSHSERLGADGLGLRAGLLAQQGDFHRALPDYENAVRLQPGNSLWWLGLGVALEAEGRGQQARQVYSRAQAIGMERAELNTFIDQKLQQLD